VSALARPARKLRHRPRRMLIKVASVALGVLLLIWSLLPVYNMVLIALDPDGDTEFAGYVWPPDPSFESFRAVWSQGYWYLEDVWNQFGNSVYVGLWTMVLTVFISSLASFAVGRMIPRKGRLLINAGLLTYVLPSSLLAIPFLRVTKSYGLMDNLWAVIAAEVMFAAPFAILILQHYAKLIPIELDEAARVDGASPLQMYGRIYLPLMAPALVAVGIYALLLSWSEYLYQYMLISTKQNWTVAVALEQFWDSDEAPWNYMMALAIAYSLPPVAVFYCLNRYVRAGARGAKR